jgi:hypothetical protein
MPPETRLDRITPAHHIDRARINAPPVDPDAPARTVRDDLTTYSPLQAPGALEHGWSPPAPPPKAPPTEAERREVLEQCVIAARFAADNVDRAHETHERAVRHVERCREALAEFDGLDQQITDATVEALRSGDGRPRVDNDDPLRRRVIERDLAQADLRAAEHALAVLFDALTDAQADAAAATKAANIAAAEIVALTAEAMAQDILDREAETQRQRELLYGFDKVATAAGLRTPQIVLQVYGDTKRFLRPVEGAPWLAARDALLADPAAEVRVR